MPGQLRHAADLAGGRAGHSLRVVLENLLRHEDGQRVTADQVRLLLHWDSGPDHTQSLDLSPSRIFLHDTNGVPALVDLAAMRDVVTELGADPAVVNPQIPAELVIDHSVIADAETFRISGLAELSTDPPPPTVQVTADHRAFTMRVRLDTAREVDYYRHGGITTYVMPRLLHAAP